MTSLPLNIQIHVFHPPPETAPVAVQLDHLVKEFQRIQTVAFANCPFQNQGAIVHCDRNYFMAAAQSLRLVKDSLTKKEEHAHKKDVDMMLKLDDLEVALTAARDERKKLTQDLKHSEKEKVKAIERARATEENIKTLTEQGEKGGAELAKEKKRVQQLQKKVDEYQRQQRMSPRDDSSDGEKKKGKESNNTTDIAGLQRGLEKAKAQLKKKQDEFQLQAVTLQQANSKIKNLEGKITEDKTFIDHLHRQIQHLEVRLDEDRAQANSEYLTREMERAKEIAKIKAGFQDKEKELMSELNISHRASKNNADKYRRAEKKLSRLQAKLTDIQNTPIDYSPYSDADIADRIRIRNLVDQTQERLATLVGLTTAPGESLSLCWRLALGPSTEDHVRILRAQELIADKDESTFTEHDRAFIENEEALRTACQLYSRFRAPGNDLHKPFSRDGYMSSVQRYLRLSPNEKAGESLFSMINYVCASSTRPA